MTGNYPGYTGAYRTSSGSTMMHRDEKTVANLFGDNGYVTGMVGKWHLGDNAPHRPQDRGFQDVVWHRCGGIGQASDYWGNDYFDDTYERNGKFEKFEGYCTDVWFREGSGLSRRIGSTLLSLPPDQRPAWPLSCAGRMGETLRWQQECGQSKLLRDDLQHRSQHGAAAKTPDEARVGGKHDFDFMTDN